MSAPRLHCGGLARAAPAFVGERPSDYVVPRRRFEKPRLVAPINRACVAGDAGFCLACGAPQGEPCRQPRT